MARVGRQVERYFWKLVSFSIALVLFSLLVAGLWYVGTVVVG